MKKVRLKLISCPPHFLTTCRGIGGGGGLHSRKTKDDLQYLEGIGNKVSERGRDNTSHKVKLHAGLEAVMFLHLKFCLLLPEEKRKPAQPSDEVVFSSGRHQFFTSREPCRHVCPGLFFHNSHPYHPAFRGELLQGAKGLISTNINIDYKKHTVTELLSPAYQGLCGNAKSSSCIYDIV